MLVAMLSIHVAIGVCIVVVVVFVVVMTTTFCCLFFSFCPVKKKQRLRKQMTPFNGSESVLTIGVVTGRTQGPPPLLWLRPVNEIFDSVAVMIVPREDLDELIGLKELN